MSKKSSNATRGKATTTKSISLKQAELWFDKAQDSILDRVRSLNRNEPFSDKQKQESANQMKLLSTSSDTKGIKFSGLPLQYQYFQTKFTKRAILMYSVLLLLFTSPKLAHLGAHLKNVFQQEQQLGNGDDMSHDAPLPSEAHVLPDCDDNDADAYGGDGGDDAFACTNTMTSTRKRFNACSIGGGPGNDSTALVLIAQQYFVSGANASSPEVSCDLYDLEKTWKNYLPTLKDIMSPHVHVDFNQCDVTKSMTNYSMNKHLRSNISSYDLFMFSYVCNETSAMSEQANGVFWRELAVSAKKGAVFVFVDVIGYSQKALRLVENHMKSIVAPPSKESMFISYDLTNEKIVGKAQVLVMHKILH